MGLGFHKENDDNFIIPKQHKFVRGNHDNPEVCRKQPNYLGDFGLTPEGYFFISGGYSIDRYLRTEGVTWWRDEELDYMQFGQMIALYEKTKPEIVVSHDCPESVTNIICNGRVIKNRTGSALHEAFLRHHPKIWLFGHYHKNYDFEFNGTRFICLAELAYINL